MSKPKVPASGNKAPVKQGTLDAKKKAAAGAFSAKNYERPGIMEQEILEIKEAFDLFDSDLSGTIDVKELRGAMTAHGLAMTNEKIMDILDKVDSDSNGRIDFEEFLTIMSSRMDESDKGIENIFRIFDGSGKGEITVEDLQRIAEQLGDNPQPGDLQEMIDMVQNGELKGFVNLEEFSKIVKNKSL